MQGLLPRVHGHLRSRGTYRKEDLFTEILSWLLARSPRFKKGFVGLFDVSETQFTDADIRTQVSITHESRLDLVIESHDPVRRLVVEIKVDDRLRRGQLERYHEWVDRQPGVAFLGALAPDRLANRVDLDPDRYPRWTSRVRWRDVAAVLVGVVSEARESLPEMGTGLDDPASEVSSKMALVVLGREFIEMLKSERLIPPGPLDPIRMRDLYECERRLATEKKRFSDLLMDSLIGGRAEEILEERGFSRWDLQGAVKGTSVQDAYSQLRMVYKLSGNRVMLGFRLGEAGRYFSDPLSSEKAEPPLLMAAVNLTSKARDRLIPDGDRSVVAEIAEQATAQARFPLFVPTDTKHQQLVSLQNAEILAGRSATGQVDAMTEFFESFVNSLQTSGGFDRILEHC